MLQILLLLVVPRHIPQGLSLLVSSQWLRPPLDIQQGYDILPQYGASIIRTHFVGKFVLKLLYNFDWIKRNIIIVNELSKTGITY